MPSSLDYQVGGAYNPNKTYGPLQNVVSGSAATVTLTPQQSGSLVLFDSAAGIVYTLPSNIVGLTYDFFVSVTITSNAAEVATSVEASQFMLGTVDMATEATTPAANPGPKNFSANGTTHVEISMNGSTTGGIKGSWFRLTCITSTLWMCTGLIEASGTIATPFAT